ncbi:MAG: hypothetical protein AAF223_18785 [Bacteroidota bacterium]
MKGDSISQSEAAMGQESLRRLGGRGKKASPPVLSHEFVIQNHGDIMSCVVMLVFGGFMFQVSRGPSKITVRGSVDWEN